MYNVPHAPIIAQIELNMQAEKQTRFVENFHRMAPINHKFSHGEERSILVFTKGLENIEEAKKAGATLAGDANLVKSIQNGDFPLSDFQYVIAHTNMLPDLVHIRGLMRRKFPSPKLGTLGTDVIEMINRFMNGITYSVTKDENQKDFASIDIQFGTLDMDTKHLESNLASVLKDIDSMRPKRDGKFITRVLLKSPPSKEELKINPFLYVPEGRTASGSKKSVAEKVDENDEEEEEAIEKERKEAVN
jgi:large subunit ribosomal protein L1